MATTTNEKNAEDEAARSALVILGEIREESEDGSPSTQSAAEEFSEELHKLVKHLRAESFRRDARMGGKITLTLDVAVHKSNATVQHGIDVKLPKPARAKPREMFTTKGGNLVAEKPSQGKLKFRDVNEPAEKSGGTKAV